MNYLENVSKWLNYNNLNQELRNEITSYSESELKDAFYTDLEFGTGGLRGILGAGTNRMNIYTVSRAALGFGRYLAKFDDSFNRGVCISYDNRQKSKEFALISAKVLTKLGFKVYLFENLRPTPELSFAVRDLHAIGGIMITASHNPKEYNGFKVYNSDGGQLIPEEADKVIFEIKNISNYFEIETSNNLDNVIMLGKEMDERYIKNISTIQLNPNLNKDFKITYTPLHGTGSVFFKDVLSNLGYDIYPVLEQMTPDPLFSNVSSSNPEEFVAYDKSIALAHQIDAELVLATDPDADRLGVCVKDGNEYKLLTGNQSATILFYYIVNQKLKTETDLSNYYLFTTIVSSNLPSLIAAKYNINVNETLTGFKFIGQKAKEIENKGSYLFGFEESYGCLIKDSVRDKDSLQACIMLCEAYAYYKNQGKTFLDVLDGIYKEYGYIIEDISSITLKGIDGKEKINSIMNYFRNNNINLDGYNILSKEDIETGNIYDYLNNKTSKSSHIKSNVIKYNLNDNTWFVLRPSGTEPKIKIYYGVSSDSLDNAKSKLNDLKTKVLDIVNKI